MRTSTDPTFHRDRERQFFEHVTKLLDDDRLRLDTARGRRPITLMIRRVARSDKGVDLKRLMSELGKRDRDLQERMPVAERLDVELVHKYLWILRSTVGMLRVISIPPTRPLLEGRPPAPVSLNDLAEAISKTPPPLKSGPVTAVYFSSSGFDGSARDFVGRPGAFEILVEPNDAGGFNVYTSDKNKHLVELLNPEHDEAKRERIRQAITARTSSLTASGIASDRLAGETELPIQLVESELKSYASENPGLAARKLDGRLVLFREGSIARPDAAGGPYAMPMIDKIRALFARRGENEKKIAFLSERRAALGQQRDRSYEEISNLESQDSTLRQQFKESTTELAKRRITSQLLQLRKDMERRQQLLAVLNQQINVVSTHLHNLELVQQGQTAKLPDSEEMAEDAAKAEEVLADLEASGELAASVGSIGAMGMSAEEQALYEELAADSAPPAKEPPTGASIAGANQTASGNVIRPPIPPLPERTRERKPSEPEAG